MTLTPRELEIARMIQAGDDVEAISTHLGISLWTVKDHVKAIRLKLGVGSMREIPEALARLAPAQ